MQGETAGDAGAIQRRGCGSLTPAVCEPCRPRYAAPARAEELTELVDGLHTGAPER